MKKNYKSVLLAGSFIIGTIFTGLAVAQQKSSYTPFVHTGYSDYKENYNPQGNKIIHSNGETTITTSHANFSFEKIKLFVPPGTKRFYAKFQNYLSSTEAKAAARFSEIPVANANDINQNTSILRSDKTLERLLLGEELLFYSPGGSGTLTISQPSSTDNARAVEGGYIYLNLLSIPGGSILSVQTRMMVDEACYRSWYANAQWDAQGNPDENATHTCAGSAGGDTTPILTDIALSPSTWKIGTNSGLITVTPVGTNNPALPANCSSNSPLVIPSQPSDGQTAKFSVTGTVATETTVNITCGDKEETLTLQPADPNAAQILDNEPTTDSAGNLIINFKLKRPDTELAATNKTNFWVAALVPKTSFPYMDGNEEWFFLTPSDWMQQNSPNPLSVAYQLNQTPTAETSFSIPTGLPQTIAEDFNAELYFGYMGIDGAFKNMGIIWKKN